MTENYIKSQEVKKKIARQFGIILIILSIVFGYILFRFAYTSNITFTGAGLPSNDDAYTIAKGFIKANTRADADFSAPGYLISKKKDSVFVINTAVDLSIGDNRKRTTKFRIIMKYKGGLQSHLNNWALLNIREEN